jgi:hypothetical protein
MDDESWVPRSKGGVQKSCNVIRSEIEKVGVGVLWWWGCGMGDVTAWRMYTCGVLAFVVWAGVGCGGKCTRALHDVNSILYIFADDEIPRKLPTGTTAYKL